MNKPITILFSLCLLLTLITSVTRADNEPQNNKFKTGDTTALPASLPYQFQNTGDIDIIKVHAATGGMLTVDVTGVPGNVQMQITAFNRRDTVNNIGNATGGSGAETKLEVDVPAGDYYIYLNDQFNDANSPTVFTVNIVLDRSDSGEWNNFFSAASPVAENDTFLARLAGINTSIPIHNDRDYYKVHESAGGLLTVNITNVPPNLQMQITVFKASDSTVVLGNTTSGSGQNALVEVDVPAGDYVILVNDQFDDGLSDSYYTVRINNDHSDPGEFNNYFADAYLIPENDTLNGSIRGVNKSVPASGDDRDFYKVNTTSDGLLVISVTNVPSNLQMQITVYNAKDSLTVLGNTTAGSGQNALLEVLAPKGSYVILLNDQFNDNLSDNIYQVTVNLDLTDGCEVNQYFAHPCTISENDTFPASIRGYNATFSPQHDVDYYRINSTTGGLLTINIPDVPPNIQMQITMFNLRDSTNNIASVTGGTGQAVSLAINIAPGSYIFLVNDQFNDNLSDNIYTVQVSINHSDGCEFNNFFSYACTVLENDTFPASIYGVNRSLPVANDRDYYKIHVTRGGVLLVGVVNVPGNLQMQITGFAAGDTVNSIGSVTGGSGQSVRLELVVPAGDYYILMNDQFDDGQSPTLYSVQVALDVSDNGEWNNFFSKATTLTSLNDTFPAKIRGVYTRIPVADDRDYYKFHATQCGNLTISLSNVPPNLQMQIVAFRVSDTINNFANNTGGSGSAVSLTIPVLIGDYYFRLNDQFDDGLSAQAFQVALSFVNTGPAIPVITPTGSTTVCMGDSIYLISNSPTNNHWTTGSKNNYVVTHNAGSYVDTVMGTPGCWSVSAPVLISYAPFPSAKFGTTQLSNTEFSFSDSSSNTTAWHWDFGDGSATSDEQNPQHSYNGPGTYTVILVAKNDCGTDTARQTVTIISTGLAGVSTGNEFFVSPNPCSTCEIIGNGNSSDLMVTDIIGRNIPVIFTKTSKGYLLDVNTDVKGILLIRNTRTGEVKKFVKE